MVSLFPDENKFLENGEDFCCFDSGDHGVDEFWYSTQNLGLDNLAKYREWA